MYDPYRAYGTIGNTNNSAKGEEHSSDRIHFHSKQHGETIEIQRFEKM
jgi:hypothetical protein